MPNVIDLLKQDHREVEGLFATFESNRQSSIAAEICADLEAHTGAEERFVYPALGEGVSGGRQLADEAEHVGPTSGPSDRPRPPDPADGVPASRPRRSCCRRERRAAVPADMELSCKHCRRDFRDLLSLAQQRHRRRTTRWSSD
jgi:Hemerythrin HHE cation binding domain